MKMSINIYIWWEGYMIQHSLFSIYSETCLWPKKKYMCVYCHMSKKSRVIRSGLIIIFFFLLSTKPEIVVPGSGIQFSKIPVKWRIMQFFYLLCSQFRQKASSWINKTLLLVKQQKWLSEFCVKMHRIASKN
jgi:hypothetical protein